MQTRRHSLTASHRWLWLGAIAPVLVAAVVGGSTPATAATQYGHGYLYRSLVTVKVPELRGRTVEEANLLRLCLRGWGSMLACDDLLTRFNLNKRERAFVRYKRGISHYFRGKSDKAAALKAAEDFTASMSLGFKWILEQVVACEKRKRVGACRDQRAAVPGFSLYFNIAQAYAEAERYDLAVELYTRFLERFPKARYGYWRRAESYVKLKRYGKAIADYSTLIRLAPRDAVAYGARAQAYCAVGQGRNGLEDANRALEIARLAPRMGDAQGIADPEKRVAAMLEAANRLPLFKLVATLAARACNNAQLGNTKAAIADYREALRLDPKNAAIRSTLERLTGKQ